MNNKLRGGAVAVLSIATLVAGCATQSNSNSVYGTGQAQHEQTVRYGVVEGVREVTIQGGQTGAGTLAGSAIGGIAAGSTIGGGNGAVAAGILGAILGGIAGSATENKINQRRGLEITVRLENGEMRAITQEADEVFRPGERVRLLSAGGVTRVTH
ncbi:outer membrane lipoprotein [Cupriavidus necator]|uniref:outer membrane lipoprotein n=1 Tax=Cupriavidus necator TaxID=106590 RepID=UPI0039C1E999